MATIVLDAGHGGYDYGAVNGTRREKDDNLSLARAVGAILQNCGQNIVYTRSNDVFISLNERSRISNALNPQPALFVSFHRNASTNTAGNGAEVFTAVNASTTSTRVAQNLVNAIATSTGMINRGIKRQDFSVVRYTKAPAVLLESGFISNTGDNQKYDANVGALAQSLANTILSTLGLSCAGGTTPPSQPPTSPSGNATVRAIQQFLNTTYNAGLVVDGLVGPATRRALVRALQMQLNSQYGANLATDGIFGRVTKSAVRLLRQGDRGNLVEILQSALYINGFYTNPDGIFGANTGATVRSFQNSSGLSADGIAGPDTFEALMT
jgi:N-acetylmuramoyl-L-alanine amidase